MDSGGASGALLTDLSKAFDCLCHELLIAKLAAYGFDDKSLKLINSYLLQRKQRVKINNEFSLWEELLTGVPQGSILGPLLFNIYICDLFYFLENMNIASYADDNTPYSANETPDMVIKDLENSSSILFKWFDINCMKANSGRSRLLSSHRHELNLKLSTTNIKSSKNEDLLGVTFDSKLNFEKHITNLCKKASQKLNALARICPYINIYKRKILMRAFIFSQFGYCPVIWMLHNRALNNRINRLHERALRIVYNDSTSCFQALLQKDNSVSIHHRNIQILATEMFKVRNGLSPKILNEIFIPTTQPYNLRRNDSFNIRRVHSVRNGTESLSYLGPKIWNILPNEIKSANSLKIFKTKIKNWIPKNCPCRLCKSYIPNVGFI